MDRTGLPDRIHRTAIIETNGVKWHVAISWDAGDFATFTIDSINAFGSAGELLELLKDDVLDEIEAAVMAEAHEITMPGYNA